MLVLIGLNFSSNFLLFDFVSNLYKRGRSFTNRSLLFFQSLKCKFSYLTVLTPLAYGDNKGAFDNVVEVDADHYH